MSRDPIEDQAKPLSFSEKYSFIFLFIGALFVLIMFITAMGIAFNSLEFQTIEFGMGF